MTKQKETISTVLQRKYWIFDLDGTLTVPVHDFQGIRKTLGIPRDKDILGFISTQNNDRKEHYGIWSATISTSVCRR